MVATLAAKRFALDRILLVPAAKQPLKSSPAVASYEDRLAMVSFLCEGHSFLSASELDRPRVDAEPNYTVSSLRMLRAESATTELFCIVGLDSFLTLPKWREPRALLELAQWIVVSRPGSMMEELDALPFSAGERSRVHLLTDVDLPFSATEIRRRLRLHEDCADLLTPSVSEYITRNKLYS